MITIPRLSQSLPFDDENTLLVIIWSCTKSIISLIYWTSLYIPSCRWCNYISAKVDGKRGRKLILYKQFKSPLKPLMKFTYIYYAQVTWLHLMLFFCIQKAEGTSVSVVLSDSRNRPLLFIRLSAIYLFLTAPTPFLLYISDLLCVSTDELSKCSGESATTLGEEVDLPNTPQGPGLVAAISVIPSAATRSDQTHTHATYTNILVFQSLWGLINHYPVPYTNLNHPN